MMAGHGILCFSLSKFLLQKKYFDSKNPHSRDKSVCEHISMQK